MFFRSLCTGPTYCCTPSGVFPITLHWSYLLLYAIWCFSDHFALVLPTVLRHLVFFRSLCTGPTYCCTPSGVFPITLHWSYLLFYAIWCFSDHFALVLPTVVRHLVFFRSLCTGPTYCCTPSGVFPITLHWSYLLFYAIWCFSDHFALVLPTVVRHLVFFRSLCTGPTYCSTPSGVFPITLHWSYLLFYAIWCFSDHFALVLPTVVRHLVFFRSLCTGPTYCSTPSGVFPITLHWSYLLFYAIWCFSDHFALVLPTVLRHLVFFRSLCTGPTYCCTPSGVFPITLHWSYLLLYAIWCFSDHFALVLPTVLRHLVFFRSLCTGPTYCCTPSGVFPITLHWSYLLFYAIWCFSDHFALVLPTVVRHLVFFRSLCTGPTYCCTPSGVTGQMKACLLSARL